MRNPGLADGLHGDGFLNHAVAEVVELGAAHLTAGHNLNLGNLGGVDGEGAFHAFADMNGGMLNQVDEAGIAGMKA